MNAAPQAPTGPGHDADARPLPRNTIVPVAGVSFHQDVAVGVSIGDRVKLVHDQSNAYDVDAVDITTLDGRRIGSVPARGGLNSRLLIGHRGGIWGGVVVDKVGQDPIGLRVKIVELLGHREAGFGADIAGRRDAIAEPVIDPTSVAEATPPTAAPSADQMSGATATATVTRRVKTKGSGRVLGDFVDEVSHRIRVRGASGAVTAYPAAVVEIFDDPS